MRHSQIPLEGRKPASAQPSGSESPERLLRLLLGHLVPSPPRDIQPPTQPPAEADEIVLDVELDGYRYILVRTLKSSRAPVELSPREKEIVRMVAQGLPNKIIAGVLNISSWTVCTHLRRVFAKLGVGSRAAMVARLHETGTTRTAALKDGVVTNRNLVGEVRKNEGSEAAGLSPRIQNLSQTRRQTA